LSSTLSPFATVQIDDSFLSSTLFIQDYEDISLMCSSKAIIEDLENDGAAGSLHRGGVSCQCFFNVNVNFYIHQLFERRLRRRPIASCCYKT
jgi:hypothetical protein